MCHVIHAEQVAGANDGWPSQFRFAGVRFCSVMAQLRMLGIAAMLSSIHRGGLRGRAFGFFISVPKAAHIVQAEAGFGFTGFASCAASADEPFVIND